MTTIPGYEVVVQKQGTIQVPSLCAGCGGRAEVASFLRAKRLMLTVGLCYACEEARKRRMRGGIRLLQLMVAVGLPVFVALIALPPLPEAVFFVAPPVAAAITAAVFWRRLRSGLAATRNAWTASPYRSNRDRRIPPTPVAITHIGAREALVYSANEEWADEFARLNRFERRPPTKRPGLHDGPPLVLIGLAIVTGAGGVAWAYKWPDVLIDNGSASTLTIWMDGQQRWTVPPKRGVEAPLRVRIPRGPHRFAYQGPRDRMPGGESDAELLGFGGHTLYNPGALACYFRYEVQYGYATGHLAAEHLPRGEWSHVYAEHLFEEPPTRSEKGTHAVLIRDDLCSAMTRARCPDQAIDAAKRCMEGDEDYGPCARRVARLCGRDPAPPDATEDR